MTDPVTRPLDVPGAALVYDVRASEPEGEPILVLIGSPMDAAGFAPLADHLTDRTVVTYDPRGVGRSARDDPSAPLDPLVHAGDVRAVIEAVGGGPVDLFASSGGALNALALVAGSPDLVTTLVAHEPPAVGLLPDAAPISAASRAIAETYRRSGWGAGMAHFIALVTHRGPVPDDIATQAPPDPARFGLPVEDDGSRDDVLLATFGSDEPFALDLDRLRGATTVVLAVGEGSEGQIAHRAGVAVAHALGIDPVTFPGDHAGFASDPEAFAHRLRAVLDGVR